jgi:hypothetical protein
MRETGIRYVVVRAQTDPLGAGPPRPDHDVRLVAHVDRDYLFEVVAR